MGLRVVLGAVLAAAIGGVGYVLWWVGAWLEVYLRDVDPGLAPVGRWMPIAAGAWASLLAAVWVIGNRMKAGAGAAVSRPAQRNSMDVEVGYVGGHPVVIPERDRYLHTLVAGTTGTGKSSRVLKPMIWQDLRRRASGMKLGLTVIEPKGDLVSDVAEMCDALGIPYILVDPEREDTARFNPLEGDPEVASEVMRTVLAALFGKQEAFFSLVQQGLIKYTIRMMKELRGNSVTLPDVLTALMEADVLRQLVDEYRRHGGDPLVIRFFEAEVLGRLADKFFQFALGVRMQVGDIVGNRMLHRVLTGKSDIDLDEHLAHGGVFLVNTAMGRLGALGDAFGQFVMLHLQYAVFRRPRPEHERIPHFLYIDEFPRYVNMDFEKMLAMGRSYRCATTLALQNTSQLVLDAKPQLRDILIGLCRNKVLLNLDDAADAERFSKEMGEREVEVESWTYKRVHTGLWTWHVPDSKRVDKDRERRFSADDLLHLQAFHAVAKVTVDGQPQRAVLCRVELSEFDRDRKKWQRKQEQKERRGTDQEAIAGGEQTVVPDTITGHPSLAPVQGTFFPTKRT